MAQQMALTSGAKIGPYEIQSPLGAGGMGEVYRARDTRLDRSVAIKILPEAFLSDADRLQRFQQEARILSSLNHPNLLAIFDVGSQNGSHYLVSELLEGKTLRERLSEGPLSLRKAVEYGVQMANGLAAAHEKGIVHRDLKPDNVFITKDGRVKILDFGLAKPSPKADVNTAAVTVATLPGVVLGTAGYMSPEQVRGQSTDLRSDIFSFGAILYEMVSGKRAFARDSSIETMNAILKEDPADVSTETKNISPAMQRLIHRCLEKAPEERFQSARDLAFALDALSGTSSTSETRLHAAPSPRKVRTTALASFAALLMLAVGFLVGMRAVKPSYPAFHQLIFGRGYIETARFTPDGQNVIYGAAWNNQPFEIFSTRLEGLESRSLGLPSANILGIASNGQMALGLGWHHTLNWMTIGTLAEVSLSGGSPRLLLEKVCDGDISQDGKQFAVVRCSSSEQTLESPIGKVLYRTNGYISHVRISPQGEAIAFCDHPVLGDDRGSVAMVDLEGKLSRLTQIWSSARGLAWQPSGQEVWFTASPHEDAQVLYAVSRNGRLRTVLSSPAYLWLQDISADGKVLLGNSQESSPVAIHRAGVMADKILDLASESAITTGISDDGSLIAIDYSGSGSGSDYAVYVAKADGSPLVRLGDGSAMGITPDGKSIIALLPSTNSTFRLLPTGAGETRTFEVSPVHALDYYGNWVRDGTKFVFLGSEPGKKTRAYLLDTTTGKASPVTPEGTIDPLISPDGKFVAARDLKQEFQLYPLAGGEPQTVKGLKEGELLIQWDTTGTKLYVWDRTFPAHVFLVDLRSGERREWTTLVPPDSAGVLYGNIDMTPDGKTSVYRYRRNVTTLFLAEGLK
jgi:eukaryotic-like serine/threonine-protein kinase